MSWIIRNGDDPQTKSSYYFERLLETRDTFVQSLRTYDFDTLVLCFLLSWTWPSRAHTVQLIGL